MGRKWNDRIEKLTAAERWSRDGLRAIEHPGGVLTIDVDMSHAMASKESLNKAGNAVTYTQMLIVAVASVLTTHSALHRLIAGNRRLLPGSVDICLSISGDNALTPVLIVRDAGKKSLFEISQEVRTGAGKARSDQEERLAVLRKWGWIVPSAFLRRALIRCLMNRLWYRRLASGTFQITVVSTVDMFVPFLFNTAAALGAGRIRDRVIAVNGKSEVRPILPLACCFDHKVWNGMDTAQFLNAVKEELERPPCPSSPR
jgi:pyruvate dehydrogenase E2 component (dihydrolipoamide acetyltransferase)